MKLTPHIQNILKNSKKDTDWKEEAIERQSTWKESKKAGLVATQLAVYMTDNGISQTALAKKINVTPQQISKVLKGRENLTLSTIEKIEEALGIQLVKVNNFDVSRETIRNTEPVKQAWETEFPVNMDFLHSLTFIEMKKLHVSSMIKIEKLKSNINWNEIFNKYNIFRKKGNENKSSTYLHKKYLQIDFELYNSVVAESQEKYSTFRLQENE